MAAMQGSPAPGGGLRKEISPGELSQRVAVIKRFKELLKAQRDRFQTYLNALDRQKEVIQTGTAEELLSHVELEEKIVTDIFSIQKVIDPLEQMYQSASLHPAGSKPENTGGDEVSGLKEVLEGLKAEAVVRSGRNRELLAMRMSELRSEINSLRTNSYARRRFDSSPEPSLVDIKG